MFKVEKYSHPMFFGNLRKQWFIYCPRRGNYLSKNCTVRKWCDESFWFASEKEAQAVVDKFYKNSSKMVVKVSKTDIEKASSTSYEPMAYTCPIARAIRKVRHKGMSYYVYVGGNAICIDNARYVGATKKDIRKIERFTLNFDNVRTRHLCRPTTIVLKKVSE